MTQITDIPNSGIYLQRGSILQLVIQLIDLNTGLPLQLQVATGLTISMLYPDLDTSIDFVASLYTDGTDGRIVYTTQNTEDQIDLSQVGLYHIQGSVTIGGVPQPPSQETDFYVLANANETGTPPNAYTASAFILFSPNGTRWATVCTGAPALVSAAQATGPINALTLGTLVMRDDTGVYWTVTITNLGVLESTPGGNFQDSIDRFTLVDTSGVTHIITISEDGELIPA